MKTFFIFAFILSALAAHAAPSECEQKVIGYHQENYLKTYERAQEVWFDYFILRDNMLHHTFAYPEAAFLELANKEENYIAAKMVRRAQKKNLSAEAIVAAYSESLKTGELCEKLGEKYKRPRKIRSFLFKKLKI